MRGKDAWGWVGRESFRRKFSWSALAKQKEDDKHK